MTPHGFVFPGIPPQASTMASHVDALYYFLIGLTVFFSTLIFGLIFYFSMKYRRRNETERPPRGPDAMWLEILWTAIPTVIVIGIFFWGAWIYYVQYTPPKNALDIYVVGKQWMWYTQHPEGQREINDLHVPAGTPVRLIMTSQDVIHSFFIPAFRIKQDVVPGRYTYEWFTATVPGTYHLFCAEYCGNQHSGMIGRVVVLEPKQYQAWLAGGAEGESLAARGYKLFQRLGCVNCHAADASGRCPSLEGVYGRPRPITGGATVIADDAYVRESILDPGAKVVAGYPNIMPTFRGLVTEDGLIQLIAYVKSLRREGPTGMRGQPSPGQGSGAVTPRSSEVERRSRLEAK